MKRIAVAVAALVVGVGIAVAVLRAPTRASASNTIPLPRGGSMTVAPLAGGGYHLGLTGDPETLNVQGRTLVDYQGDGTVERTTYHGSEADLWRSLGLRFGVTKAAVEAAAAGIRAVSGSVTVTPGEAGETETTVIDDYAQNPASLRAAVGRPVAELVPVPAGLALVEATMFSLDRSSPKVHTSIQVDGVAHLVYSADPAQFGFGDSEIIVDSAQLDSSYGDDLRGLAAAAGSARIASVAAGTAVRIASGNIIIFTKRLCVALTPQGDVSDATLEGAARSLKELG